MSAAARQRPTRQALKGRQTQTNVTDWERGVDSLHEMDDSGFNEKEYEYEDEDEGHYEFYDSDIDKRQEIVYFVPSGFRKTVDKRRSCRDATRTNTHRMAMPWPRRLSPFLSANARPALLQESVADVARRR